MGHCVVGLAAHRIVPLFQLSDVVQSRTASAKRPTAAVTAASAGVAAAAVAALAAVAGSAAMVDQPQLQPNPSAWSF